MKTNQHLIDDFKEHLDKKENNMNKKMEHSFMMKMDKKLYNQLKKYSQSKNQSLAHTSRRAIKQFIDEQSALKDKRG